MGDVPVPPGAASARPPHPRRLPRRAEARTGAAGLRTLRAALTPQLRADGSELPPAVVRAKVESFLASAPAAWDPYLVSR